MADKDKNSQLFASEDLDQTKDVYNSLEEKLKIIFDSLVRDKLNLELQVIESKKFKLAVEAASDHIIITDPDGLIIYANKAIETISGYTYEEVVGKNPGDLWGGRMPKEYYAKMWDIIKNKKQNFKDEINNVRKNGERYIAELNITPVMDEHGEILFFVGIERDITKEKEVAQMKSEFVGLVSHQLRTPLTGIRWFSELLLRNQEKNLSEAQIGFIKQIADSNLRMIGLVNDMLNISHIETGRKFEVVKKSFNLGGLVQEVLKENIFLIQTKNLKIVNEIPETLLVFADYDKLRQVWQNLINNATKYTQENKSITITATPDVEKGIIFAVKDEGIGVPAEQQKHLFEKFFRADNAMTMSPNGNGLGLYIAREIARAHGGEMWIESVEGQGSTFYFSIPLRGANEAAGVDVNSPAKEALIKPPMDDGLTVKNN